MFYEKTEQKRHSCYKCSEELVFETKIGRRDMCPNCTAYLHCCYNCKHHDRQAENECRENQAEFIRDRTEGNFCVMFEFKVIGEEANTAADAAKARLAALFGSGPAGSKPSPLGSLGTPKTETDAKAKLDALFKK